METPCLACACWQCRARKRTRHFSEQKRLPLARADNKALPLPALSNGDEIKTQNSRRKKTHTRAMSACGTRAESVTAIPHYCRGGRPPHAQARPAKLAPRRPGLTNPALPTRRGRTERASLTSSSIVRHFSRVPAVARLVELAAGPVVTFWPTYWRCAVCYSTIWISRPGS